MACVLTDMIGMIVWAAVNKQSSHVEVKAMRLVRLLRFGRWTRLLKLLRTSRLGLLLYGRIVGNLDKMGSAAVDDMCIRAAPL